MTLQYPAGRGEAALRVLLGAHQSGAAIAQAMFMGGDESISAAAQEELAEMLNPKPIEAGGATEAPAGEPKTDPNDDDMKEA